MHKTIACSTPKENLASQSRASIPNERPIPQPIPSPSLLPAGDSPASENPVRPVNLIPPAIVTGANALSALTPTAMKSKNCSSTGASPPTSHPRWAFRCLYRHAHATGLYAKRQGKVRRVLDRILEGVESAQINGDCIIRAVRAYSCLGRNNKWTEPATNVVFYYQNTHE
jgi:hypothetical protein